MSGQIFERKGWAKTHYLRTVMRLKKLKLDPSLVNFFRQVDKKEVLVKNFVYLVRLNDLESKNFIDHVLLLDMLFAHQFAAELPEDINWQSKYITNALSYLSRRVISAPMQLDLESDILKDLVSPEVVAKNKTYFHHHRLYQKIANIYYQPFAHLHNAHLYYQYGYYLAMLLTISTYQKLQHREVDVDVFLVKLRVIYLYNKVIAEISPMYFNDFIRQNNYFMKKY